MDLGEVKFKEINMLLSISQCGSLREVARRENMAVGQVSKWMSSLESKLGFPLLDRSAQGVSLTAEAKTILPDLKKLQSLASGLEVGKSPDESPTELTFATASFFSTHLIPEWVKQVREENPNYRFRVIDVGPNQMISTSMRGGFHGCLHLEKMDWPRTWSSVQVGELGWGLYCREGHPSGNSNHLESLLQYAFVYPIFWSQEGLKFGNDNCPLPIKKRQMGDLTATAGSAIELVARSDQMAFMPEIVARPYVERGILVQKNVKEWSRVTAPVYLTVKSDRVTKKFFEASQQRLKTILLNKS